VTHEETFELLPVYALGALDQDVAALEAHLDQCLRCQAEMAACLRTTARLGQAMEIVAPPPALREAVLAAVPVQAVADRGRLRWFGSRVRFPILLRHPTSLATAAALVLVVLGLAAWNLAQQRQLRSAHSELMLDRQGLALLTSTETINIRLNPVAEPGTPEHGHWYHRPGIQTQVLVIEFMPKPSAGASYYGWLQGEDGSWRAAGAFPLDDRGHGRLILLGDDGSGVKSVAITRQSPPATTPQGRFILRGAAP
jgi:hypothetical protein